MKCISVLYWILHICDWDQFRLLFLFVNLQKCCVKAKDPFTLLYIAWGWNVKGCHETSFHWCYSSSFMKQFVWCLCSSQNEACDSHIYSHFFCHSCELNWSDFGQLQCYGTMWYCCAMNFGVILPCLLHVLIVGWYINNYVGMHGTAVVQTCSFLCSAMLHYTKAMFYAHLFCALLL
jgi:hypothetical protein